MALTQVKTSGIADDAVTLAKQAAGTDGQIITYDASGNPSAVGPGTDGQVLTSTGAGSPPAFETISTTDSLSFRNRIINGAMEVNQRNNTNSIQGGTDAYYLDRWKVTNGGGGEITVAQQTDAPAGLVKSLKITVASPDSDIQASDWARVYTKLEGNTTADFCWGIGEAKTATVSFWVKSSLTGNFAFAIGNGGQSGYQSYQTQYTINAANTWEKKTITISGATGGTYAVDNTKGICLFWGLKGGSQYNATVDQWNTTDTWFPANSVQVLATNAATWFITGVQFELGSTATDFEYRTYPDELLRCWRYFYLQRSSCLNSGRGTGASNCNFTIITPVNMRTTPSISLTASSGMRHYGIDSHSDSTTAPTIVAWRDTSNHILCDQAGHTGVNDDRVLTLMPNGSAAQGIELNSEL